MSNASYYLPPATGNPPMQYVGVDAGTKPGTGFANPMYTGTNSPPGHPAPLQTSMPYPGPPPPGFNPNQQNQGYPPPGHYPPPNQTQGPFVPPQGGGPPPGKDEEGEDDPQPTAPPISAMQPLPGYEHLSFDPAFIPPPSYDESQQGLPPQRQPLPSFVEKRPDEARDVLLDYVSENCCYGKRPARDMIIQGIKMTSAFHYKLETFTEKRETSWEFEPYDGRKVLDGPMNGPAPPPWSVPVPPPAPFTNDKRKVEVPHTASSRVCHSCGGGGRVQCRRCWGRGTKRCTWCNGRGHKDRIGESGCERCTSCSGTGYSSCWNCSGSGMVKCKTCDGKGQLKCFVQLTVTWTNHLDSHIYETTDLPEELVTTVKGQVAFEEQLPRVWPVSHFPNPSVNDASKRLVNQHSTSFPMERIIEQRHSVQVVPVSVISYTWKDKRGDFFIYGLEDKVYFPDYPASCCWGCSIL